MTLIVAVRAHTVPRLALGGQLIRLLDLTVDVARVQHAHAVDFKSRPIPLLYDDR
jgi:hypothetical protein